MRQNAINTDLSSILPEEVEAKLKEEAEISMGTDISETDLLRIGGLCDQIIELTQYRYIFHILILCFHSLLIDLSLTITSRTECLLWPQISPVS